MIELRKEFSGPISLENKFPSTSNMSIDYGTSMILIAPYSIKVVLIPYLSTISFIYDNSAFSDRTSPNGNIVQQTIVPKIGIPLRSNVDFGLNSVKIS